MITRIVAVVGCWMVAASLAISQNAQIRISGESYVDFGSDRTGLSEYASSGALCVIHRPDCGSVGHNGKDHFFSKSNPLPAGVTIVRVDYLPFWPIGLTKTDRGGVGSEGSYGVDLENIGSTSPPVSVHWQNACQSSGSNNWQKLPATYQISFILSGPQAALDEVSRVNPSVAAGVDPGFACQRKDTPGPRPGEVAIEKLTATWNGQTVGAGKTLVVPVGNKPTIAWSVANCGAGCEIGLEKFDGTVQGGDSLKVNNLATTNSIQALATDTVTTYLMGASDAASRKVNDIESAQVTIQLTTTGETCPGCQWYYYQLSSPSGSANPECFTYAAYGTPASTEAAAQGQATNYSVKQITEQQYYTGCSE